ncbi:hypothetical protein I2I05_08620 [Hymenobacter sp. BT683]|uniref:Uncharacterized protein n=1 Tax=Hymenobacter jeongseonensis TaxID=2791027 RepID=A0ABS0IGI9_9BACT|nr:hypothetical protein [Hymenobacter jeongseonensis]MBF9237460.1 hypothetical protein [Hymenobacter jeongseonensis]
MNTIHMNVTTTITITDFIKKYELRLQPLADLLGMCQASFRNKLNGVGKSKPFTGEQLDALHQYIQAIGIEIMSLRQAKLDELRNKIHQQCSDVRFHYLDTAKKFGINADDLSKPQQVLN